MTVPDQRVDHALFDELRRAGTGIQFFEENHRKHSVCYHEKRWDQFTRISIDFEPEDAQITLTFAVKPARLEHLLAFKNDLGGLLRVAGINREVEPTDKSVESKKNNTTKGSIWVTLPYSEATREDVAREARAITDAMRQLRSVTV